jgi:ATP-binding cassette subfamily B protein
MSQNQHTTKFQPRPARGFGGGRGNMLARGSGEKAKDFRGTIKQLINYLWPYWFKLVLVLVFTITSTLFLIVSPKILGRATNQIVSDYIDIQDYELLTTTLLVDSQLPTGTTGTDLIEQLSPQQLDAIPAKTLDNMQTLDLSQRPSFHFTDLRNIIMLLIGLYVLSAAFSYIQDWVMTGITQKVTYQLRKDISQKINRLPLSYFDKHSYGEVLSRVTNDVDTVSRTLNQSISQTISSLVMIVGVIAMMLSISWLLTLVTVLILPLSLILIAQITKRSQPQFAKQQTVLAYLNGHIEEIYSGHVIVKAFNGSQDAIQKFKQINADLYDSAWKSQFLSSLLRPLMSFVGNLGYVGVAIAGGWLAISGKLQIGDIQAFIQYVQQFNQPITQVANISNVMQSMTAAAERVFEFLAVEEQAPDTDNPVVLSTVKGQVEFDHVVFAYNPGQTVIKNLSIKIQPGHRIAIVGPIGAGKTTLVNLLMRFYEVDSGAIKIDGVDIKQMRRSDVRQIFGMVLQDTWLFNGSIRDNITYGNPQASEEELFKVSHEAQIDHLIQSLPKGYDMMINEDASNISQGEKQLLTIARAMLAGNPLLILDEATSSVDTRTEVLI